MRLAWVEIYLNNIKKNVYNLKRCIKTKYNFYGSYKQMDIDMEQLKWVKRYKA